LIEENYKRLDGDARRVIEALAVFRRPVPPLAVDYLLEPFAPGLDLPGIIRRLTRTNIVNVDRATKTVTLHPIDQDYAYSRLPEEGAGEPAYTRQALERRAADYYVQLRTPSDTWKTIDDLEPQLAEFDHRVRAGDYDDACRVLDLIDSEYLYRWGHYARLVGLQEKLLGQLTTQALQAANLGSLGRASQKLGQVEQAIEFHEQALAIACEIGDRQNEGIYLGLAYQVLGQTQRIIKSYFEEALAIAREIDDRRNEGFWLGHLGNVSRSLGQFERAIGFYEEALAIARETDDWRKSVWLSELGNTYGPLGQIERSIDFCKKALNIAHEYATASEEGTHLGRLGFAYRALGQIEKSIESHKQALSIAQDIGHRRDESAWLGGLGNSYHDLGQIEQAIKFHRDALRITREIGDRRGKSLRLLGLGRTLLTARSLAEARQCCTETLALDVAETSYRAALTMGIVLLHQRDAAAGNTFADAAARCQVLLDKTAGLYKPRYALATALVGSAVCNPRWAEEDERVGLLAPALEEYRRALENCAAPGVVRDALRDLELIRTAGTEGLEPAFELLQSDV
jgi:tetratricopeptide (TPR) repeat protein